MDSSTMKRLAVYLFIAALGVVVAWQVAPRLRSGSLVTRDTPAPRNAAPGPQAPPGSVLVNVNMVGFDPDVIEAKVGQPLKLAFFRPNAANCGREVVFPDLGIQKELPPGQTTVVEITPTKTGPLVFECGMKMLKGQLIVR